MIPLHVHSFYSPLAGVNSPQELCHWARDNQLPGIALTDTNALYGAVHFHEEARKVGLSPLVGAEVVWSTYRLVVLCANKKGYEQLCLLLTDLKYESLTGEKFRSHLISMGTNTVIMTDCRSLLLALKTRKEEGALYYEFSPGFSQYKDVLWCRDQKIPLVGSTRARFIEKGDDFFIRLGQAVHQNQTLDQVDLSFFKKSCRLISPSEASNIFQAYPEMIENTYKVFRQCRHFNLCEGQTVFPRFNGWSKKKCDDVLRKKSFAGIKRRYEGVGLSKLQPRFQSKLMERLEHELEIISKKGFSSYFLVVEDIVRHCPRTCGRGSAAASLVSFLLGITHVDPLRHNLYFERFLNPDREDPPDIDIDFPWDERDAILNYVFQKYPHHSAMVSNHNSLQAASAIREVAKVYGVPLDEINEQISRFPKVQDSSLWKTIFFQAKRLQGHFRHLSVHPGGVVITPNPIASYVPIEKTQKGVPIMHWEKRQVKKFGLVKIDLLGNRSLAVIRDTISAVNRRLENDGGSREKLTYDGLDPLFDTKARKLIESGGTLGVFYIESPASRMLLQRMKSSKFEHIVMASSIIRPAANEYALEFVKRLHGKPYYHLHPLLRPILEETYGIMIYQEQVSQTAIALAGFSMSEGNELRKVLDKKDKRKRLRDFERMFFEGGGKKGIDGSVLGQVWKMILSFSGYSFCKAHSASYAMVSFKSCYLKSHFPAEFMSAVMSHGGGFYSLSTYLEESRRLNLKVLLPDINLSEESFQGHGGSIRVGLQQLSGITEGLKKRIIEERRNKGPFSSVDNFLFRVSASFEEAKVFVKSRAFSSLKQGESFCSQMWRVYEWFAVQKKGRFKGKVPSRLFREFSPEQLIEWEMDYLKSPVSFPSWALYPDALKNKRRVRSVELTAFINEVVILFGVYVTAKVVWTKKGEEMCFATFSDEVGLIEAVFFPPAYISFRDLLYSGKAFMIKGRVENILGALQVQVYDVSLREISLFGNDRYKD
ncbi:MAG: DNA polymerase III subunit alpha [Halobacteriovoraceae bacterium]|nr:DNA polymerase III subunit alpha [Halobacteriovoraceae bacterium]